MRREHIVKSEDYIEWLKSFGCVFYAPLTENDSSDNISGQPMTVGNNGTVTWDSNENAWYFQDLYSGTNDVVASWQGLNLPFDLSNIGFSICYELKLIEDGFGGGSYIGKLIPLVLGGRTVALNARYLVNNTNEWTKCAVVFPKYEGTSRYSYLYCNGSVTHSDNRGTTQYTGNSLTNTRIDSNYRNRNMYSGAKYYMRNAMLFNANLTQAQIREIQNI